MSSLSRRHFLRGSATVALGFLGLRHYVEGSASYAETATSKSRDFSGYGDLVRDRLKILDLPPGFSYRVLSRTGDRMSDGLLVPGKHDGMAAFPGPNGKTILVRNHENQPEWIALSPFGTKNELLSQLDAKHFYDYGSGRTPGLGGTTTLVYDTRTRTLESHFLSLAGTYRNCAGGPTPWGSWITCEETVVRQGTYDKYTADKDHGYNFEVPASVVRRLAAPVPLKEMGRFNHEAVAVDAKSGIVYQTEDRGDGLVYRFIPRVPGRLAAGGRLQALKLKAGKSIDTRNWPNGESSGPVIPVGQKMDVEWLDCEEIDAPKDDLRLRGFEAGAARFSRGEGMWTGRDAIYIACTDGGAKKKGQIWRYMPSEYEGTPQEKDAPGKLELYIEPNDGNLVDNADNITIAPWGDLVVAEDGWSPQCISAVTPQGRYYKIARNALNDSEFAGVTFSPDATTLFVNIQTPGLTLAITGPWQRA